jgi:hypothetical protein
VDIFQANSATPAQTSYRKSAATCSFPRHGTATLENSLVARHPSTKPFVHLAAHISRMRSMPAAATLDNSPVARPVVHGQEPPP